MFRKKGQAALEFLMTYGWAILVVLAAIGALAYFGVLSPDRFLPEKCTLPSGIACLDFNWHATDGFTIVIQNAQGFDMATTSITLNGTDCSGTFAVVAGGPGDDDAALVDGEKENYRLTNAGCIGLSGKYKGELSVSYTNQQTGLTHTKSGELIAKTG